MSQLLTLRNSVFATPIELPVNEEMIIRATKPVSAKEASTMAKTFNERFANSNKMTDEDAEAVAVKILTDLHFKQEDAVYIVEHFTVVYAVKIAIDFFTKVGEESQLTTVGQ